MPLFRKSPEERRARLVSDAESHLEAGETLLDVAEGGVGSNGTAAMLIATDRRAMVSWAGTARVFEYASLHIAEDRNPSFIAIQLTDGVHRVEILVDTGPADPLLAILKEEVARARPPAAVVISSDPVEQLKGLAALRDAGVLSVEEFEAKKKTLLDKIG